MQRCAHPPSIIDAVLRLQRYFPANIHSQNCFAHQVVFISLDLGQIDLNQIFNVHHEPDGQASGFLLLFCVCVLAESSGKIYTRVPVTGRPRSE